MTIANVMKLYLSERQRVDSRGAEGMRADNESMEARLRKLAARVQVLHQQGKSSADLDFTKVSFMTEQTLYEACMVGGARRQQPRAADSYGPLTRCTLLAFSSATTAAPSCRRIY